MRSSRCTVARASLALRAGGVIAYPTEAVFGLGCDPWCGQAFEKLLRIKGRAMSKGVILIAAQFGQLRRLLDPDAADLWPAARRTWPGPVTWIMPARRSVPSWLTGGRSTIAVRVTDHPVAAALSRAFGGPLVSTSANRSGSSALRDARKVRLSLGSGLDFVVHAGVGGRAQPSEIRDAVRDRVLRAGD